MFIASAWEDENSPFLTLYPNAGEWTVSSHYPHLDKSSIFVKGVFHEEDKIYLLRTDQNMDRFVGHPCDCVE